MNNYSLLRIKIQVKKKMKIFEFFQNQDIKKPPGGWVEGSRSMRRDADYLIVARATQPKANAAR